MHSIEINYQGTWPLDLQRLQSVVQIALRDAGVSACEVSIAVVNDAVILELNRRHLNHDYATDVLSFRLDDSADPHWLEGEIIVSAETAERNAHKYGWTTGDELTLYVLHGALHLVGHDDAEEDQRRKMRAAEVRYLARLDQKLGALHARLARISDELNTPQE
jgi:probable rRNA maturation factor